LTSNTLSANGGENIRLDKFLSNHLPELSRTKIKKMIIDGLVYVNNAHAKASLILDGNELISYTIPNLNIEISDMTPQEIPLEILYEDEFFIAINKQAGLVVHPGNGNNTGTLANGLVHYFNKLSDLNGFSRPGIIHRLDKDTSGVILIAKDNSAHRKLASQFENRTIKKEYFAITWGVWNETKGIINNAIKRKRADPTSYQIDDKGRESITNYELIKQGQYLSSVAFYPKTGRTHQIRVHSSSMGHPIFGDNKYGGGNQKVKGFIPEVNKELKKMLNNIGRHALHAKKIIFNHPDNNKIISIEAPIPSDIKKIENKIDTVNG
jgi:23S rRNA pseudouridine1911/1915/1917 synthase